MTDDNPAPPPLETPLIRPQKPSLLSGLRSSFIAGIVVAAPMAITAYIVFWFVTSPMKELDSFVRRILPAGDSRIETITQAIPGFGLLVALIAITALGAFAKNFLGRAMIRMGEKLLDQMPVVRSLHRFFKNVFETALQKSARSFKEVGLIQYPRQGLYAIAFVVGDASGEVAWRLDGAEHVGVFVPTVPNPTSGFLLYVPRTDFMPLTMSIEDAAKVVFSLGLVVPEFSAPDEAVKRLEQMAERAAVERRSLLQRLAGK
ncbi:MAG TPA: hypothetical protein DDZ68_03875 [Parvularcula sp.]|nr:hypothetical protein [Parvularcula sp.]HBS31448.1 hypothetical protein [Parvularcula sp.]HBS36207.1 hypothetical protein [Parvularcula sp.]